MTVTITTNEQVRLVDATEQTESSFYYAYGIHCPNDIYFAALWSPGTHGWSGYTYKMSAASYVISQSDSSWGHRKTGVAVVPRKNRIDLAVYLRVPVKPLYNPPKLRDKWRLDFKKLDVKVYPFAPPRRRAFETDGNYTYRTSLARTRYDNHLSLLKLRMDIRNDARKLRWEEARKRFEKRKSDYDAAFKKRLIKYDKRLSILEKRRAIVKLWQKQTRLVYRRPLGNIADHPYHREQWFAIDPQGLRFAQTTNLFGGWDTTVLGGPYVSGCYLSGGVSYNYGRGYSNNSLTGEQLENVVRDAMLSFDTALEDLLVDEIAELDAKLLRKLGSKIRGGELHLGNIIGERAQTLGMFRDTISRIADLASGKKKLCAAVSHFIRNPRLIANDFLAFKFGVEPLLKDAHALGEKLAEIVTTNSDEWIAFRVNNRKMFSRQVTAVDGSSVSVDGFFEISYVVKYSFNSTTARYLSDLGLVNPAEIAWELMPWSFVIDWVLPVQRWLENSSKEVGLQFMTGTRKIRFQHTSITSVNTPGMQLNLIKPGETVMSSVASHLGNFARSSKKRTVLSSLPEIPVPVLKNPFSTTHVMEALALIVQRLF